MMGASDVPESLGGGAAAASVGEAEAAAEPVESGSGNRWPPEETVALLNIRCGMDSAFRDASLKAPLWEEVSRKLGEAGFNRTAKKCKEKFENVYKYHRRTKDGRSGGHHKHNARTYRFFHQLEALDNLNTTTQPQPLQALLPPPPSPEKTTPTMVVEPISAYQAAAARSAEEPDPEFTFTTTTSSSSSDQSKSKSESETQSREAARKKKKKKKKKKKEQQKLSGFFERLMTEVMGRQEALQRQFIEAIDRCERERRTREEAWKTQELAKIKREQELLAKERAAAAAKDAAVIACLQKLSEKAAATNSSSHPEKSEAHQLISSDANADANRGGSSSRWPKAEVEALIKIRTDLDLNQHNHHHPCSESGGGGGSKGPLWEDVSAAMKKMGYDRSSKRCKEKWENINKYFRRVKDRKRKRPQDSKTCPYFHQLDAIYRTKNAPDDPPMTPIPGGSGGFEFKPEELLMQMVGEGHGHRPLPVTDGQTAAGDEDEDEEDGDCNGGEVEGGDAYRIVPNNTSSAASMAMMG